MRWRRDVQFPRPRSGETRTRVKFAWIPENVEGDQTVWLEFYLITEQWNEFSEDLSLSKHSNGARIVATAACWRPIRVFAQPKT